MRRSLIRLVVLAGALFVVLTPVEAQTQYCTPTGSYVCEYWCGRWGSWFSSWRFGVWYCCLPGELGCSYYYTDDGCCF